MSSPADRNIYRLQGALHRITQALRQGRENLFRALMAEIEDEEFVKKMPSIVQLDKALGKPIGDVSRSELIEMMIGRDDLLAIEEILHFLTEGEPEKIFADYDEACRRVGALRNLIHGD